MATTGCIVRRNRRPVRTHAAIEGDRRREQSSRDLATVRMSPYWPAVTARPETTTAILRCHRDRREPGHRHPPAAVPLAERTPVRRTGDGATASRSSEHSLGTGRCPRTPGNGREGSRSCGRTRPRSTEGHRRSRSASRAARRTDRIGPWKAAPARSNVSLRDEPRGPARVGVLRRSRRGPHLGLRRDVPHQRRGRASSARAARACSPRPAPELVHGCCRYGAHFIDDDDVATRRGGGRRAHRRAVAVPRKGREAAAASSSRAATATTSPASSTTPASSSTARASPAAPGCALHLAALEAGERPLDWKPDVCWQLPLRLEEHTDDHGHVTSTLREWKRRDWGEGGFEFHWWCTDAPDAFVGRRAGLRGAARRDRRAGRRGPYVSIVGELIERDAAGQRARASTEVFCPTRRCVTPD